MIEIKIGPGIISSYKRLSYTLWHAIAEFVDNSTQSYFNNRAELKKQYKKEKTSLFVKLEFNKEDGVFIITDNAMGMDFHELSRAMDIGKTPENNSGRSQYGLGLKTGASWIGDKWSVVTKKLGEAWEHRIEIDVEAIATGNTDINHNKQKKSKNEHYTIITIEKLNHSFAPRSVAKIKQYLGSMYRVDFRNKELSLYWNDDLLKYTEFDDRLAKTTKGSVYRKDFNFTINEKKVSGWVGVLANGSRRDAGFSILKRGRVIKGWPESWRPHSIYGDSTNDLVNQRLIGEISLDDFMVSHTKDEIQWMHNEEEEIEKLLKEEVNDYRNFALSFRKGGQDERRPKKEDYMLAASDLEKELKSSEINDALQDAYMMPPKEDIDKLWKSIISRVTKKQNPSFDVKLDELVVKLYLSDEHSPSDPYIIIDYANGVEVIVNLEHPHLLHLHSQESQLNFLRHCVYDGVAEWQSIKKRREDLQTIRTLKDRLLRVAFEMEQSEE